MRQVVSVDRAHLLISKQEEFHGSATKVLEDLEEALPETSPRYVILSYEYKQSDGRVSYPLMFIYYSPIGRLFHVESMWLMQFTESTAM